MNGLLVVLALALAGAAPPPPPPDTGPIVVTGTPYGACGPRYARLYVAPLGEPVRTNGTADPMRRWFDRADADRDGRLTAPELAADAQRFFATIDTDRDGVLDPQEVSAYEIDVAPEIMLYQSDAGFFRHPEKGRDRRTARHDARSRADYETPYGAGQYASLNIPEPVAAADLDIDRGVSRDEFARVAASRFALLDSTARGYLGYDALPRSPVQQAIDACYAKEVAKPRR